MEHKPNFKSHLEQQRPVVKFFIVTIILVMVSFVESVASPDLRDVRARTDRFLQLLRSELWNEAASFVAGDPITQQRLSIPHGASPGARSQLVATWLEALYRNVKPGPIYSIELDPQDPSLALVTYRAGDLDAFNMRLTDGEWMYTLDWKPRSSSVNTQPLGK